MKGPDDQRVALQKKIRYTVGKLLLRNAILGIQVGIQISSSSEKV